jgi:DNA-binding NtrC family response regulator
MVLLSLESENGAVLTYRLAKNQISVGSSSRNDVVVRSPGVAEKLLVIHRAGDKFTFVTAERQTVVLNGERRSRGVLNPGDKLRLGGMTLIFRGVDNAAGAVEEIPNAPSDVVLAPVSGAPNHVPGERFAFRNEPGGFGDFRARMVELLFDPGACSLKQIVTFVAEAIPGVEVALVGTPAGGVSDALASVWSGDLPRLGEPIVAELRSTGKYALLSNGEGGTVVMPIIGDSREVVAFLVAKPMGILGEQGTGMLGELSRHLSVLWGQIGRYETRPAATWEDEARQRVETLLPGTSQAMQVLRAGLLAAAYGNDPALICGATGVGRTEVGRILATLGPIAGRPVVVADGRTGDSESLRRELFGPSGHPSFGPEAQGAVARARGGFLVIRNIDGVGSSLQEELAALISAQQREQLSRFSFRWVVTCGEDPLALVQQGKLAASLFLLFSHRMLRVPRLAERREDMPLLVASLIRRVAGDQSKTLRGITLECLNVLLARPYPGEMAELVLTVNRLVTASADGEMVRCEALTAAGESMPTPTEESDTEVQAMATSNNLKELIPSIEKHVIDRVMRRVKGNQSEGSRILGISRGALIAKLKEYEVPDYRFLRRKLR